MLYGQQQYGLRQYGQAEVDGAVGIRLRTPAPDAVGISAVATVSFELFQAPAGFDGDTIRIYINGTLAIRGERAAPGFVASVTTLSDGYAVSVQNPLPWETGLQTVRAVGGTGLSELDTTWSFATQPFVVTEEAIQEIQAADAGFDLLLSTSHDIYVQSADLALVAGADEVTQHLGVGLRLFRGEWYLDEVAGVPYYQSFFVSGPNTRAIEATLRQHILSDPDIDSLIAFEMEFTPGSRRLSVSFLAESTLGQVESELVVP